MTKSILVTGDLICDYNLVRSPMPPAGYHDPLPEAVLRPRNGGAWYLRDMVNLACSDMAVTVAGPRTAGDGWVGEDPRFARAFSIWAPYTCVEGDKRGKDKQRVWRISNFLGCEPPENPARYEHTLQGSLRPDVIVIDDANQEFRKSPSLWPTELQNAKAPTRIVLKTSSPLAEGQLWHELIQKHSNRLTVVISAAVLRDRHADLSTALSWEHTIEDMEREIREGKSSQDLAHAHRVVVRFGHGGVALYLEGKLERFVYHPAETEDTWASRRPGTTFGATTLMTAAFARHALDNSTYPPFIAAARALAATRENHEIGGNSVEKKPGKRIVNNFTPDAAHDKLQLIFHPVMGKKEVVNDTKAKRVNPEDEFRCAFPNELLEPDVIQEFASKTRQRGVFSWNGVRRAYPSSIVDLLEVVCGSGYEFAVSKAMEVVLRGIEKSLNSAPQARYGNYVTVDRDEIERINEIRRLISNYRDEPTDIKPLAIAVFGPPGAGKSFAIKELASTIFPAGRGTVLEFNMSQFGGRREFLHSAFHIVRDASIRGEIPLVFWDEFDVDDLKWLIEFLAPIQDAGFMGASAFHTFGKSIFVFAGGTRHCFEEFNLSESNPVFPRNAQRKEVKLNLEDFRSLKGPDFVSRLRGYVNIKGPNQSVHDAGPKDPEKDFDVAHLLRRAIILRSNLERNFPRLIDDETGVAKVSANVIRAFLRVKKYKHGARSMEALLRMSALTSADYFGVDRLPSNELLELHVDSSEFARELNSNELDISAIEEIAKNNHEYWATTKAAEGIKHGNKTDDIQNTHSQMSPYDKLDEEGKDANRDPARKMIAALRTEGYELLKVRPTTHGATRKHGLSDKTKAKLAHYAHDFWLRDHYLKGWYLADDRKYEVRLHPDCKHLHQLRSHDAILDDVQVESTLDSIEKAGYKLVNKRMNRKQRESGKGVGSARRNNGRRKTQPTVRLSSDDRSPPAPARTTMRSSSRSKKR